MRRPARINTAALILALGLFAGACSGDSAPIDPAPKDLAPKDLAPPTVAGFAPLNRAVGYGTLRVMDLQERPSPRDIVIYESLPNEIPRVAGVITTVAQTPLSHVNLRAVQDKIPNAYIADALTNETVTALTGKLVRYEVNAGGYRLGAATQQEVEAHFAAIRPTAAQVPVRDLSVRRIARLGDIGFGDWKAYGVKAANLATLRTFALTDAEVPDGFAIPFSFYDEFMKASGLDDRVRRLLADESFRTDLDRQERELARLRDAIKDASMPGWMVKELTTAQRWFPAGTSLRCRSSTNNEDLPNFSGAGLYDSRTQRPDEGHLSKCVKQVYASLWNHRAFLEREFYRVDHLATAMGVLVHPNFDGEQLNGVAVSTDPLYGSDDTYYVNVQKGEDLVTNPDALSIPEEILLYPDGDSYVVAHSNLAAPGTRLLGDAHRKALQSSLRTIHERFAALYAPAPGEKFAMEIEFKVTAKGALAIKQARTWVFS